MGAVLCKDSVLNTENEKEDDTDMEPEPFQFEMLPPLLQSMIIREVSLHTYNELNCCNRYVHGLCANRIMLMPKNVTSLKIYQNRVFAYDRRRSKFITRGDRNVYSRGPRKPLKLKTANAKGFQIKADTLKLKCPLTSKACRKATEKFRKMESIASMFQIRPTDQLLCSHHELEELVQVLKCDGFFVKMFLSDAFLKMLAMKQWKYIYMSESNITDSIFLSLTAQSVSLRADTLSDTAVMKFIQECQSNTRDWSSFTLTFLAQPNRAMDIAHELGVIRFWTRERHSKSVLAGFPFEEMHDDFVSSFYCFDALDGTTLLMRASPQGELYSYKHLTERGIIRLTARTHEQRYLVNNYCPICYKPPFCKHFNWYSIARLRRNRPRIFYCFILFSKAVHYSTYLFAANNIPNIATVASSFVSSFFEKIVVAE